MSDERFGALRSHLPWGLREHADTEMADVEIAEKISAERRKHWERVMEKNPEFADAIRQLLQ